MELEYKIEGIDCANCAREIEEKINKMSGVEDATLNFLTQKLNLEISENVAKEDIEKNIIELLKDEEPDATFEEI